MGRKYTPAAADIKVGYQEIQVDSFISNLDIELARYFSSHYFRYLDDVFQIWRISLPRLDDIKHILNSTDPNIIFTFESSLNSLLANKALPYLDVLLWVANGRIITDIYNKPTDTFNYLPFSSSHPRHICRNIPYSLARRIKGIVSDESKINSRMTEMKNRLIKKSYPAGIINNGINKALKLSRNEIIQGNIKDAENKENLPIYFVNTHNTTIKNCTPYVRSIIDAFNVSRQHRTPIIIKSSYRKSPSLKELLMYRPLNKPMVRKCGKNCTFCDFIHEGQYLTLKNGKTVFTNGNFECSSRNVVYIVVCHGCKEFYIGETGDELQIRWTVHRCQSKLSPAEAPVHADIHMRICGKNKYSVFPFYRPKKNDMSLRRHYEDMFISKFEPKLNGKLYS